MEKDIQKEKEDQLRWDTRWVVSTEQGRRFVWEMLCHCGIYRAIEGTTHDIVKQEGKRQIGLLLMSLISDASEDLLFQMMKEAKQRDSEEKIRYDNRNSKTRDINRKPTDNRDTFLGADASEYIAEFELPSSADDTLGGGIIF